MTKDKSTAIALLGIGAVTLYALTRKQEPDDLGVFPDAWSGGSATPATPPTPGITPIINFPEVPPYVEQQPPAWLFYPPLPSPDHTGSTGTHKKETVPPGSTSSATYTTGDPIHENIGPAGGFGGGGAGGRGGSQSGGIGNVLKSLFSPLTLLASVTPFGIVTVAPKAGLALATAVTKKDEKVATEKSAFESGTDSATSVAGGGGSVVGGGGSVAGGSGSVAGISAPSGDIADFFTSGKSYGSATVVGQSSAGTVYQHSGGARSVVSGGQIVASSSRALSSSDIARLPKKMRQALGY